MANVFQATNSGYRDPLKAMTLKALEDRAKTAAAQTQQDVQFKQITSPWQGVGDMINAATSGINEARTTQALASGRQELANTIANIDPTNGPSMQDLAKIGQYDPDLEKNFYDQAMELKKAAAERQFQMGEHALDRSQRADLQAEAEKATATNQAAQQASTEGIAGRAQAGDTARTNITTDAANARSTAEITAANTRAAATITNEQQLEKQREAAQSALSTQQSQQSQALEDHKYQLAMQEGTEPISKIEAQYNTGGLGKVGSPEAMALRDRAEAAEMAKGIRENPNVAYAIGSANDAVKRHSDIIGGAMVSKNQMNQMHQLAELGKRVQTGPGQAMKLAISPYMSMFGVDPDEKLSDLAAYQAMVNKMAPNMHVQGTGHTNDFAAKQFLNSLPSISNLPGANKMIEATFAANDSVNQQAAGIARQAQLDPSDPHHISWQEADSRIANLGDPFAHYNDFLDQFKGQLGDTSRWANAPDGTDTGGDNNADPLNIHGNNK